jgi:hypothetical protein
MVHVFFPSIGVYDDVIEIDHDEFIKILFKNRVHALLEVSRGLGDALGHAVPGVVGKVSGNGVVDHQKAPHSRVQRFGRREGSGSLNDGSRLKETALNKKSRKEPSPSPGHAF